MENNQESLTPEEVKILSGKLEAFAERHYNTKFQRDLQEMINSYCIENSSNTPDFILAEYLIECLLAYEKAVKARDKFYDHYCGAETVTTLDTDVVIPAGSVIHYHTPIEELK